MRIPGLFLITIAMLLSACSAHYLIISQDNLTDYPCATSDNGVNVRIKNAGKIVFTSVSFEIWFKPNVLPGL